MQLEQVQEGVKWRARASGAEDAVGGAVARGRAAAIAAGTGAGVEAEGRPGAV